MPAEPGSWLNGLTYDTVQGCQDSLLVERRIHDQKVVSFNPGRCGGRIFFSRINFLC